MTTTAKKRPLKRAGELLVDGMPSRGEDSSDVMATELMQRFGAGVDARKNRIGMVLWMAANLEKHYLRPVPPDRPKALPDNDEIFGLHRRFRAPRPLKLDIANGTLFGAWRSRVEKAEYEAAHRLRLLIWAAIVLNDARKQHPELKDERDKILAFIERVYGLKVPPVPPEYPWHLIRFTTRFDVLPWETREGRKKPRRQEYDVEGEKDPGGFEEG